MRLVQKTGKHARDKNGHPLLRWLTYTFSGEVDPLYGCPDIAVSHAVYCHSGKGSGQGKEANSIRVEQMRELGYSAALCTVVDSNFAQIKILTDGGWVQHPLAFTNKRTGARILTFMKEL